MGEPDSDRHRVFGTVWCLVLSAPVLVIALWWAWVYAAGSVLLDTPTELVPADQGSIAGIEKEIGVRLPAFSIVVSSINDPAWVSEYSGFDKISAPPASIEPFLRQPKVQGHMISETQDALDSLWRAQRLWPEVRRTPSSAVRAWLWFPRKHDGGTAIIVTVADPSQPILYVVFYNECGP